MRVTNRHKTMRIIHFIFLILNFRRQIREAPILFVAAVAEVIRRNAFHGEFNEWLVEFIRRCSEFIKDENLTRAEFYCKVASSF